MRYFEVCLNTPAEEIDRRCEELSALGAEGFVIENEADFRDFLENNRQYWDYVDEELAQKYAGVSRIKCYLCDDEAGRGVLRRIRAAYEVQVATVEDSDWENNWREYYKPIETGEKLVADLRHRRPRHDAHVPGRAGALCGAGDARARSGLRQRHPRHRRAGAGREELPRLRY